jgi:raffinose/stachyose/melibiose transport system substrate-binding protein
MAATAAKPKGTISFWTWAYPEGVNREMIALFKKSYPDIDVELVKPAYADYLVQLKAAASADALPDVFAVNVGALMRTYVPKLEPLDKYAERDWGSKWQDNFFGASIQQTLLGDPAGKSMYGIPIDEFTTALLVNAKLFKDNGLALPKTFDELKQVSAALVQKNIVPLVMGCADMWQVQDIYQQVADQTARGKVYEAEAGKASWTDPGLVEALQVMVDMFKQKIIYQGALGLKGTPDSLGIFTSGQGAMVPAGSWMGQYYFFDKGPDYQKQWDTILFPPIKPGGKPSRAVGGPNFQWVMSANSKNKEAAWTFIRWGALEGRQDWAAEKLVGQPAKKSAKITAKVEPQAQQTVQKWLDWSNDRIRRELIYPELKEAWVNAVNAALGGQKTPAQAMANVQKVSEGIKR